MAHRGRLTPLRRELLLIVIVLLLIASVPVTTPRYESFYYEGILTIGGPFKDKLAFYNALYDRKLYDRKLLLNTAKILSPYALSSSPGRILIYCTEEVPVGIAVMPDPEAFSRWIKANCWFRPMWRLYP